MGRRLGRVEFQALAIVAVVIRAELELPVVRHRQVEEPLAGLRAELHRANIDRVALKTAEP